MFSSKHTYFDFEHQRRASDPKFVQSWVLV